MKKFFALSTLLAMLSGQLQAQDCCTPPPVCCQQVECCPVQDCCVADCNAYCDGERASYMSALLPVGALVVAAVIIATTDSGGGHHHHHHRSGSYSSHSCSHAHSF